MKPRGRFPAVLAAASILSFSTLHAQDPVDDYLIAADSLSRLEDEGAFARFVRENAVLAGAVVYRMLDVAIIVGEEGRTAERDENIGFAEHIARYHAERGGSRAPLDLARVYRGWTAEQRALRTRGNSLEEEATKARGAGDYAAAERLLLEAGEIYRSIGDAYSDAVVWGSLGVVAWNAQDFDRVQGYYEKALAARRAIDDRILEGRTLNGLGSAAYMTGRFAEAADYYTRAIELRRLTGDLSGLGTSLTYLGNVHTQLGNLTRARDAYTEALELLETTGTPAQLFDIYNSIAALYEAMGRMARSNEAYDRALGIALSEGDPAREIAVRSNIALNLDRAARYTEALEQLDLVAALLERHPDPLRTMELHRNRGLVYLNMGELERAREDLLAYLDESRGQSDPGHESEALIKLGYLFLELGAFGNGLAFADSALSLAERQQDPVAYREAHVLAAQLGQPAGRLEESLSRWRDALAQDEYDEAELRILEDRMGIANVLAMQGKAGEARGMIADMRDRIRSSGSEELTQAMWFAIAHTFEGSDPDSARHYYERALDMIEEVRAGVGGAETGGGFLGGSRRYYYEEVARYYAGLAGGGDPAWSSEAFRTIERAKARGLLDLLEHAFAGEAIPAEEAVLDSIYRLDPAASDYRSELRRLERRYARLRRQRIAFSTGALPREVAGLGEVRSALPKKTVIFAYALGDSASQLWVIDRDRAEMHGLPARPELQRRAAMLVDAIRSPGGGDAALRRLARELYEILLLPGRECLEGADHLVIVPDGCLFEIPFEVLLEGDAPGDAPWSGLPLLARRHAPLYAPSVSVYLAMRTHGEKVSYGIDLLAAGDPDYSALDTRDGRPLAPLPETRAEVEGIGARFEEKRRTLLLGADASEAAVKAALRAGVPRIVHLAAHGLVDPAQPSNSSIALCPGAEGTEDGYLHTLEILAQPVRARLVVLSACESGRGRLGRGEGVVGLTRAFLGAGAQNVISSLWAVPDESTSALMRECYDRLVKEGEPPHAALNGARLKLLGDPATSHPFYWAAFVATGSGAPVR
ncbi:MAG: CHAT domain-containing protein [Candidatus Krumholzibacteria bacterium]|nr:CHAT domain-containing protein [Candidatus Krumholzibacteria bacterium]